MSAVRSTRLAVLVVSVLALSLSGCGRRGPLEEPSAARKPEATATGVFLPGTAQSEKPAKPKKADRPFILDPLI